MAEEKSEAHENVLEHRHSIEFFLGGTHEESEDELTSGISYEYRLHELFGIGGLVEYAARDFDKWILGLPFYIHPFEEGLRFTIATALEREGEESEFLFRTGIGYEFEFDRWIVLPEFNIDFVDGEESYVYGVSLGWKF
jgi:hypothetical protein